MITVDYYDPADKEFMYSKRGLYEDNSLIQVTLLEKGETDNWGDMDCVKNVTLLHNCDIHIDAKIAKDFKSATKIRFVNYSYYRPAYYIDKDTVYTKTVNGDGSILFQCRAMPETAQTMT